MRRGSLIAAALPAVSAIKLLLPLYVYPSNSEGAWDTVYAAIAANPILEFQVILNCNSGPGSSTAGYNSDWITAVAKLNSYSNVQTFGYVDTAYGARAESAVETDIANWANWNTYTKANIAVKGIFFDEVPDSSTSDVPYMKVVTSNATSAFSKIASFETIYNLGTSSNHAEYFDGTMASSVVVGEYAASAFTTSLIASNTPSGKAAMTSWLIKNFIAANLANSTVKTWLSNFAKVGAGSVIIADYGWNQVNAGNSPADIGTVAAYLSTL